MIELLYSLKEQNTDDKRSKALCLTEEAYKMKEELLGLGEALEKQITENLTNEEHEELCFLLNKMINGKRQKVPQQKSDMKTMSLYLCSVILDISN